MNVGRREGSPGPAFFDFSAWTDPRTLRRFAPPRRVVVLPQVAWPGLWGIGRDPVSLRVRAGGLRLEPEMPGRQAAWLQTSSGIFLAVVALEGSSSNQMNRVWLQVVVEAAAVRIAP